MTLFLFAAVGSEVPQGPAGPPELSRAALGSRFSFSVFLLLSCILCLVVPHGYLGVLAASAAESTDASEVSTQPAAGAAAAAATAATAAAPSSRVAADHRLVRQKGAISVTHATFSGFLHTHSLAFMMFYAPWCYWSRAALPEFDASAKLLSHHTPPIISGRVDCTENEDLCTQEGIREYPTIRLYVEGTPHLYEGRRQRTHMVHWVDLKVDRDKQLMSPAHLDELISSSSSSSGHGGGGHVVVVAAFPLDYSRGAFQAVARLFGEEVLFGDTTDPSLIARLKDTHIMPRLDNSSSSSSSSEVYRRLTPPFAVVFAPHKGEDTVHIYPGQIGEVQELRVFIRRWLFPVITLFDADSIVPSFFSDPRPKLLLLLDTQQQEEQQQLLQQATNPNPTHPLLEAFREVAETYRGSIASTISGNRKPFERQLISLLGMEEEALPQARILSVSSSFGDRSSSSNSSSSSGSPQKFKPVEGFLSVDVTKEEAEKILKNFVSAVLSRQLSPYFRSETPPDVPEPRGRVKTLVASTFKKEIEKEANVLVEFYAPWCGFCRKMEPAYNELAKRLAEVPGVVVARLDATRNEVDGVQLAGYPTVYLYRKGDKEPVLYTGDRSTRDMMHWLSSRVAGSAPFDPHKLMAKDIYTPVENASVLEEL